MGLPVGHVFVARGDITRFACDWWLLPSGTDTRGCRGDVSKEWLDDERVAAAVSRPEWRAEAPSATSRAAVVVAATADAPGIIAVHTGEAGTEDPAWFADALLAASKLVDRRKGHLGRRPIPLLALPLVGTGRGGAGERRAGVLEALLERAQEVAESGIDVVLVLANRQAYSAAQRLRVAREELWRRVLDGDEMNVANDLARHARSGKLVPFLGAGVSAGAGLPNWEGLLARLSTEAGLRQEGEIKELSRMDPRDSARVIQQRLGGSNGTLDAHLRATFSDARRGSLTHALVGSLPIREAATTNYDRLFECSWGAAVAGPNTDACRAVTILPREDASDAERWLLKLHGDVDDTDPNRKLVLSRDDYQRFERQGGAIASVLQAVLLTRHVLIIGYGLRDETFHRIAHEVREIGASDAAAAMTYRPTGNRQLGTALLAHSPGLFGEVWNEDLRLVDMSAGSDDIPAAARRQDVLLDRIGALAAPIETYVLGAGWGELTSHGADEELKTALDGLRDVTGLDAPLRRAVDQVLERFGRDEQD